MDPEDMRELLSSYHDTCPKVVQAFGSFLAHLLGDGVVIYFGYPKAHEDDEIRAVRCALAIQEAVKELRGWIQHPYEVRIGIHRGRVVVGSLGGASGLESVAIGDAPNIASRLQAEAMPGSVVVSDPVWRLISNVFEGEYLGNRRLKGVRQPLDIYRIVRQMPATHVKRLAAHYVGREAELAALHRHWQEALNGQSQAVLIRGEPGIGKSRFIEQFLEQIEAADPDILFAHCNTFTADTPYFPLAEMLRHRLAITQLGSEQSLQLLAARLDNLGLREEEALPLIARFLFQDIDLQAWPVLNGLSLARQRKRTQDLLIEVLIGLAHDGPLLLVVEDLHWADASTIEFLEHLFNSMDGAQILVLLSVRLEFRSPWEKQVNCNEIPLENLVTSQARGIIRNLASGKALPSEVVRQICQRAEGNPLFLEEITLSVLASAGVIERETLWELTQPFSADVVPASLEAALMARLDRLGSDRNLLQLGATIGREFRLDLLATVAAIEIDAAEELMQQMVDQGFLRLIDNEPSIYRFKHALIQDVAYQSLLRSTRQQNHARIAAVLAESFPDLARQRPELMAHHLSGAGRYTEAARLWLQAGQEAAGRSAVHEAVEHLNRGLMDLDQLPQDQERWTLEFQLQTSLAPTQMAAFGWASPLVESTCLRAIDLADSMAIGEHRFALLWGLWSNQFVAGRLNRALDTAQQLQRIAQTSGVTMHAIAAHNAASYTHFYRGEYSSSIQQADQGLALFNRELELELCLTLQSAPTVHILSARSNSLWMLGRHQEAYEGMEQMLELARSLCHPPSLAASLCYLCFSITTIRIGIRS
jgi:class 3 adenylate cyclase/tetratricopeptide (TPR) repeat protein